jgi:SWI/SNF-related matrix-associated actin-dependent regulator of chromatin subfamily A-like protein 1
MKSQHTFDYSPRLKPLPHQLEATKFLIERDNAALFDEQGLGKTKIVIDALAYNFELGNIEAAIVICKKSLLANWQAEVAKHSKLKSIVLRGTPKQKGLSYMWFAHFYLINYELVPGEVNRLKGFLLTRPMALVLDESQRIKNPEGKATQAILSISPLAKRRYIITGTPVANSPRDLWAQVFFLDGGLSLGETPSDFCEKFEIDPNSNVQSFRDESGLKKLRSALSQFSIRRLKDDVLELPSKIYKTIQVDLEPQQREMYDQLRNQLYLEIVNLDGQEVIDNAENILKRLLRLVQIASNPHLIDKSYSETPAKFVELDRLISEIIKLNEKVIVWTGFVGNVRLLRRRYEKYGAAMIYGDVPIQDRQGIVETFQNSSELNVLVANPGAAREGITLTAANHAIYLDRNFNLVDYLQSQDRIHRIGQQKNAYIYGLIGENTIDAYIEDVVYRKQLIAQYIYSDTEQLDLPPDKFTKQDILRLLGAS